MAVHDASRPNFGASNPKILNRIPHKTISIMIPRIIPANPSIPRNP
jgi:hypothetical protein